LLRLRLLAATLLGVTAALAVASNALAKGEHVLATLDAPMPADAQPGDEVELGWSLTVSEADGSVVSFIAEGIFVRLLPASGDPVEFPARRERAGHYVATITVPKGGIAAIEIGLAGTTCTADGQCHRGDEMFTIAGTAIGAGTGAEVAPPPAGQAGTDTDAQASPEPAPASSMLALVLAAAVAAVGAGLIARRGRERGLA
jgi:hypothetical protein